MAQRISDMLMPLMLEQYQQRQGEKRRQERAERLKKNYMVLSGQYSGPYSQEEMERQKLGAYAELTAEGATPPASLLKEPESAPDYSSLLKYRNVPADHPLWNLAKYFDNPVNFINVLNEEFPPNGGIMSLDEIKVMQNNGWLPKETPAEDLQALFKFTKNYGTREATANILGQTPPTEKDKDYQLIYDIMHYSDGTPRTEFDYSPQELMQIDRAGGSISELRAAYGIADNDTPAQMIMKIKQDVIKQYLRTKAMMAGMSKGGSVENILTDADISMIGKILTENRLPDDLQYIADFIKQNELQTTMTKLQMKQYLQEARSANKDMEWLSDEQIDYLLQVIYNGQ